MTPFWKGNFSDRISRLEEANDDPPAIRRGAYSGVLDFPTSSSYVPLPWELDDEDGLLDLTDPVMPTVVVAGLYIVTTTVRARSVSYDAIDLPATLFTRVDLDYYGKGVTARNYLSLKTTTPNNGFPQVSTSLTYWVPEGGILRVVAEHDASVTVKIDHETYLVKV